MVEQEWLECTDVFKLHHPVVQLVHFVPNLRSSVLKSQFLEASGLFVVKTFSACATSCFPSSARRGKRKRRCKVR